MPNKKIFIIFLISSGFLVFSFSAHAIIISQIYFTDFSMERASFTAGEEIRGNFTLWNYEKEVVPDITYSYKLLARDSSGLYTIVLDEKFSGDNFSLKPDQKVTKSFSYRLPQNLPSGGHRFRVQLFNSKGLPMSREDADITIQSDDKFLILSNHFLLKDNQELSPAGSVIYDAGQVPQVIFEISNKSSFQISASPRITLYYYNITENPLKTVKKESITLEAGKSQNKTFDLIDFEESGNYVCRLTMYDNNNIISNSIDFRWKVSGKKAEIVQVKVDETSYEEGEEAVVTTDLTVKDSLEEEKEELQVTIYDKDGDIVGKKREEIAPGGGRIETKIPLTKDVANPKVAVEVIGGDQEILDRYEAQVKDDEITEEPPGKRKNTSLIIGILLIVIIIFLFYIWRKKFSATKTVFIMFLVFGGIFLSANSALAVEEISSGPGNNTAISWSAPLPEYLYEEGNYVPYLGHTQAVSEDPLLNNEFEFFIAELNRITTTTHPIIPGVEIIDEDNSEVIKLGELSLPDEFTFVDYEKPVQLPSGLAENYLGEAWLCVQFRGENAVTGDWHWEIACQEVTIQPEGEGCLYLKLLAGETEAGVGEEVNFTVEADSKCPCIRFKTDIILIIDTSGSMTIGTKMADARNAAKAFLDYMDPVYDRIGLISYDNNSELEHGLGDSPGANYINIKNKIDSLTAVTGPQTCISCGIKTANDNMAIDGQPENVPYHILMTDGKANRCIVACTPTGCTGASSCPGTNPEQDTTDQAELSADADITIYTIGFMVPASAVDLMEDVADITGGQYFDAPTGAELEEIYGTIAGLLLGKSPGTRVVIDIPDNFIVTDPGACTYDATEKELTCDMGDLLCKDPTEDEYFFEFTLELASGSSGENIEVKATIENDLSQKKEDAVVITVSAPEPPTLGDIIWDHCNFNAGELSMPSFNWHTDEPQTDYEIEIIGEGGDTWSETVPSLSSAYAFIINPASLNWIRNNLLWGRTYNWRVKIRADGQWSDWSDYFEFIMPAHSYPRPDFSISPKNPPAEVIVTFEDSSKCYSSPGNTEYNCKDGGDIQYVWDFDYDGAFFDTDSNQKGNVTTTYNRGGYTVGLKISDDTLSYFGSNNYCIEYKSIGVTFPLPEYKEVPPVGWLDNFLARLTSVFH